MRNIYNFWKQFLEKYVYPFFYVLPFHIENAQLVHVLNEKKCKIQNVQDVHIWNPKMGKIYPFDLMEGMYSYDLETEEQ